MHLSEGLQSVSDLHFREEVVVGGGLDMTVVSHFPFITPK